MLNTILAATLLLNTSSLNATSTPTGPIVVPGTRTATRVAGGTLTVECKESGECAKIYLALKVVELPNKDGTSTTYSFTDYVVNEGRDQREVRFSNPKLIK